MLRKTRHFAWRNADGLVVISVILILPMFGLLMSPSAERTTCPVVDTWFNLSKVAKTSGLVFAAFERFLLARESWRFTGQ